MVVLPGLLIGKYYVCDYLATVMIDPCLDFDQRIVIVILDIPLPIPLPPFQRKRQMPPV